MFLYDLFGLNFYVWLVTMLCLVLSEGLREIGGGPKRRRQDRGEQKVSFNSKSWDTKSGAQTKTSPGTRKQSSS